MPRKSLEFGVCGVLRYSVYRNTLLAAIIMGERKVTQRTGVPTMLQEAQNLSKHLTTYSPILTQLHEENLDLLAALASCAQCLVSLINELAAIRDIGD